jgi:sugar O-acyltransferase (sialic acid O-acetyltransferase NeuD family)
MIKPIFIPKLDENTAEIVIREWYKKEMESIVRGEKLLAIETDKAVIDIEAEDSGILLKILAHENGRIPIPCVVGLYGDSAAEIDSDEFKRELEKATAMKSEPSPEAGPTKPEVKKATERGIAASPAARRLAREKGIDLSRVEGSGPRGEITAKDIMALADTEARAPIKVESEQRPSRVMVIGAGDGGKIVAELLGLDLIKYELAGFLDDKKELWGQEMEGSRVLGGTDQLQTLSEQGIFDSVIISITANMTVRRKLFEKYRALGYKFINIIHPSVFVSPSAQLGTGNLIYGMVYIGTQTKIGDNNLISAHSSIDHHNKVGSHNLFGPGCLTSGDVTIGDSCIFGAGVGIEPHLKIGNNIKVASGLAITSHVADGTVLKSRFSLEA